MRANKLSVNKTKKESQHDVTFAKGGDTPMFGHGDRTEVATEDSAGPQPSGQTGQEAKTNQKFAEGGSNKMFGYSPSVPATAGQTGAR